MFPALRVVLDRQRFSSLLCSDSSTQTVDATSVNVKLISQLIDRTQSHLISPCPQPPHEIKRFGVQELERFKKIARKQFVPESLHIDLSIPAAPMMPDNCRSVQAAGLLLDNPASRAVIHVISVASLTFVLTYALLRSQCTRFYLLKLVSGGEGGIRTLGTLLGYGALAKRCFRPLSHLTHSAASKSAEYRGRTRLVNRFTCFPAARVASLFCRLTTAPAPLAAREMVMVCRGDGL